MSCDTNDQYVVFADIINKITRTGGKVQAVHIQGVPKMETIFYIKDDPHRQHKGKHHVIIFLGHPVFITNI